MEQQDYDSRTALHITAAEGDAQSAKFCQYSLFQSKTKNKKYLPGHVEAVIFLTKCKVNPHIRDRYDEIKIKK